LITVNHKVPDDGSSLGKSARELHVHVWCARDFFASTFSAATTCVASNPKHSSFPAPTRPLSSRLTGSGASSSSSTWWQRAHRLWTTSASALPQTLQSARMRFLIFATARYHLSLALAHPLNISMQLHLADGHWRERAAATCPRSTWHVYGESMKLPTLTRPRRLMLNLEFTILAVDAPDSARQSFGPGCCHDSGRAQHKLA